MLLWIRMSPFRRNHNERRLAAHLLLRVAMQHVRSDVWPELVKDVG